MNSFTPLYWINYHIVKILYMKETDQLLAVDNIFISILVPNIFSQFQWVSGIMYHTEILSLH